MVIEDCCRSAHSVHRVRPSIISFLADSPIVQAICPETEEMTRFQIVQKQLACLPFQKLSFDGFFFRLEVLNYLGNTPVEVMSR